MIETTLSTQFGAANDATSTTSFQVRNGSAVKLYIGTSGTYDSRVGIGITTPSAPLTIVQAVAEQIRFDNSGAFPTGSSRLISAPLWKTSFGAVNANNPNSDFSFQVQNPNSSVTKLFVGTNGPFDGNVGIGTITPGNKLEVNGTAKVRELIISEIGWPDYVFEAGYDLLPLAQVEDHIRQFGKLPGIPSAREVEGSGIKVGQAQALLLQKIEEMTLYLIALKKDNDSLRASIESMSAR